MALDVCERQTIIVKQTDAETDYSCSLYTIQDQKGSDGNCQSNSSDKPTQKRQPSDPELHGR